MPHAKITPGKPPLSRQKNAAKVVLRTKSTRRAQPCKAKNKDGSACKKFAMYGQEVCNKHGGKARQGVAAAERRIADEKARRVLITQGVDVAPVVNHLEALRKLAGEVLEFLNWAREQASSVADKMRYTSDQGIEQLRSEIAVYERAQDRAATVLMHLARVDIDSRLAAVEEAKALMMAEALTKSLLKAAVPGEMANIVRREFARRLMVMADDGGTSRFKYDAAQLPPPGEPAA